MAKRYFLVFIICGCALVSTGANGRDTGEIPPGMELRRVGNINLVLPQGVKVTERDGLIIIEPLETFVARRLQDMEMRIEEFQQRLDELERRQAEGGTEKSP